MGASGGYPYMATFMLPALIEILLRLSTAKYWSESLLDSVRIAVLDISNDQKKL